MTTTAVGADPRAIPYTVCVAVTVVVVTVATDWPRRRGQRAQRRPLMRRHHVMPAHSLMWPTDSRRARRGTAFGTPTQ